MNRLLLSILALLAFTPPAMAMTCSAEQPLDKAVFALAERNSVFIGKVVSLKTYFEEENLDEVIERAEATIEVTERFQGNPAGDRLRVSLTYKPDGLKEGRNYLFYIGMHDMAYYAGRENEPRQFVLWAGGCSPHAGTMPLADAAPQIEILRTIFH